MELNICHLYPDILNLYGDRGNILCMQKRLEWRGIGVTVTGVSIGQALEASAYDLLFVGGGQDFEQEVLLGDLAGAKTKDLKSAIEDGLPVLAICGGYQMLGQYYKTWDGAQCDFTGALDLYTIGSKDRMIGNYMFTCDELNCEIVGFENHSGKTYLGAGVKPMGKVLAGFGNNGFFMNSTAGLFLREYFSFWGFTTTSESMMSSDCSLTFSTRVPGFSFTFLVI